MIYKISLSNRLPSGYKSKDYLIMFTQIITVILLISIYVSYMLIDSNIQRAIIFGFTIVGIPSFFFIIPIISVYSILKKEKIIFIISGLMILIFYFCLILFETLLNTYKIASYQKIILFFILSLIFIELGLKVLNFDSMKKRITQNMYYNNNILNKFNKTFNKNLIFLGIFVGLSFLVTYVFIEITIFSDIGNIGLKTGSVEATIFFTIFAIITPLFLWFFCSNDKRKISRFFH